MHLFTQLSTTRKIIFIIVFFLITIPLITFLAKGTNRTIQPTIYTNEPQGQSIDNTKDISLYFAKPGTKDPITNLSATAGNTIIIDLYANIKTLKINGFDITILPQKNLTLQKISDGLDAQKFTTPIFNNVAKQRFAKVTLNQGDIPTNILHLATLEFIAETEGTGNLQIKNATITSETSTAPLTTDLPTISYSITP